MKKLYLVLLVIVLSLGLSTPAFALFTNGGFETGDFTGWNLDFGRRDSSDATQPPTDVTWGTSDHGRYAVIDSTGTMPGQTLDINPYNGTYMARINDIYGGYHATRLWQEDAITQTDIDDNATLYVNWGAALIEPSNTHPTGAQPFFGINVNVNGVTMQSFMADALAHSSDPSWVAAGSDGWSPLYYKAETFNLDLGSLAVGDVVRVELFVADCGWSGHGGYAFLDGIGTVDPGDPTDPDDQGDLDDENPVPEPMTMLLFGPALLGLVGMRKKKA